MSIYIGPPALCQVIADTPDELNEVIDRLNLELDYPARVSPRWRPWLLGLGAIELSRREFIEKMAEIEEFGRGTGPKLSQICR